MKSHFGMGKDCSSVISVILRSSVPPQNPWNQLGSTVKRDGGTFLHTREIRENVTMRDRDAKRTISGAPPRCPGSREPCEKLKFGASARDVRFPGFAKTLPWKLRVDAGHHFAATPKSGNRAFAYIAAPYGGFPKLNFLRKIFSSRFATEVGRD